MPNVNRAHWLSVLLVALTTPLWQLAASANDASSAESKGAAVTASPAASSVHDLQGRPLDPLTHQPAKAVVLIFVSCDCPIANAYAPTIERMYETYKSKGVRFWLVYADPTENAAKVRSHQKEFRYQIPALLDPQQRLVAFCKAKKTPEAFLFAAKRLEYRGRIDDRVTGYGKSRKQATRHDLQNALDAVLAGKQVAVAVTEPVGCLIPSPTP